MKYTNNILTKITLAFCVSIFLVACGGSTNSSVNNIELKNELKTVSGTVPGTIIEAFCKDGSYYKVSSTKNDSIEHPFSLTIPTNKNCKLVMTTNEDDPDIAKRIVTPITLSDGSTTSTYFEIEDNVHIGHINLAVSGVNGVQVPLQVNISEERMKINKFSYDPLDKDNDGIPNIYEDDDNDGIYNKDDDDDDNDGIADKLDSDYEKDSDGDGIENEYDKDDDNDGKSDTYYSSQSTVKLPTSYTSNNGRLLSSQCFQCHGTNGNSVNSWDSIAGEDDLLEEMRENHDAIMNAHTKGYSDSEIIMMESWLRTLKENDDD
jgi:hypothetical protein